MLVSLLAILLAWIAYRVEYIARTMVTHREHEKTLQAAPPIIVSGVIAAITPLIKKVTRGPNADDFDTEIGRVTTILRNLGTAPKTPADAATSAPSTPTGLSATVTALPSDVDTPND